MEAGQRGGNTFQWLTEIHFNVSGGREKQSFKSHAG